MRLLLKVKGSLSNQCSIGKHSQCIQQANQLSFLDGIVLLVERLAGLSDIYVELDHVLGSRRLPGRGSDMRVGQPFWLVNHTGFLLQLRLLTMEC